MRSPAAAAGAVEGASRPPAPGRALGWIRRRLLEPEPPLAAVEVRARSLGLVRFAHEHGRLGLAAAASLQLPPGTLELSMARPNVLDPEALRRTLKALLERAGILSGARVGLVLPDPVARVALIPEGEVPGRGPVEEMLRFRLRKAVPFEIRDARVVYAPAGGGLLAAAAVSQPVLAGYEEAFRALGLQPGLVELAGLALLRQLRPKADGDRLLVNWDEGYVSILLTRGGALALVRTLAGDSAAEPENVAREVATTILYHRERLGGAGLSGAAVRCAVVPLAQAVALLEGPLGLPPDVVDPWPTLPRPEGEGATQALAGALACVLGGVA